MRNIIIIIVAIFCVSIIRAQSLKNIQGSVWTCEFIENMNDSLLFNIDSTYKQYNCEIGEFTFGLYEIVNDTLYLHQQYGEYDDQFEIGSKHRAGESLQKYILTEENKLQIVFHRFGDKSINKDFNESYLFSKIVGN
jgi:hypothetical protein